MDGKLNENVTLYDDELEEDKLRYTSLLLANKLKCCLFSGNLIKIKCETNGTTLKKEMQIQKVLHFM